MLTCNNNLTRFELNSNTGFQDGSFRPTFPENVDLGVDLKHFVPNCVPDARSEKLPGKLKITCFPCRAFRGQPPIRLPGNVLIHYDPILTDVDQVLHELRSGRDEFPLYDSAKSSPTKNSGPSRAVAHLVTRTIVAYLIETAFEQAVVALISAML